MQAFDSSPTGFRAIAEVATWAETRRDAVPGANWRVMEDTDGSVFLIPLVQTEPAFAIVASEQEYEVLVCDPYSVDEIGPFASLGAALDGVSWWLQLPDRKLDLPDPEGAGLSRSRRPV